MENDLGQSRFTILIKRSLPTMIRIINTILYSIFKFIRTYVKYAIDQIKN